MGRTRHRAAPLAAAAAAAAFVAVAVVMALTATGIGARATAAAGQSLGGPETYQNPVHPRDFPDPFVLREASGYYAYGTHRGLANIQILRSDDLVSWTDLGTALPFLAEWASGPFVWAPSVLALPGAHVLYYSVRERSSGLFCVSRAVSAHGPHGPFIDRSTEPLICQRDRRGTIDPSPFVDTDGTPWLLHKSEGIENQEPTRIWIQRLAPDGQSVTGPRHQLLVTDQPWEEPIIENPAMIRADGRYFLFYSANRWQSADYAVGWAACDTPAGPCHKPMTGPLFGSANGAAGPGGVELFTDHDGGAWMAYHAWSADQVGYPEGARSLRIDRVSFARGRPWVHAPTTAVMRFDNVPGPPPPASSAVAPAGDAPTRSSGPAPARPARDRPAVSAPPDEPTAAARASVDSTPPVGASHHPVALPESPAPAGTYGMGSTSSRPAGHPPGGLFTATLAAILASVALLMTGQRAARARSRAPRG